MWRLFGLVLSAAWAGAALAGAEPLAVAAVAASRDASIAVGERRAILVRPVAEVFVVPEGSADVARMGKQTVVVTGRRPGSAELCVVFEGREWSMPLTITGPTAVDLGAESAPEARVQHAAPRPADPPLRPEPAPGAPRLALPVWPSGVRDDPEDGPEPRLTGIMRMAQGPVALLDGSPAGVGERLGAYVVERVDTDRVLVNHRGRRIVLSLAPN